VRWAALTHDLGKATTPAHVLPRHLGHEGRSLMLLGPLSQRLRVPVDCQGLAELVAREHGHVHRCAGLGPTALVRLLDRCDAWRRPERFEQMLQACECDARGRGGFAEQAYPQADHLRAVLRAARAVDTAAVAAAVIARGQSGPAVGQALHATRCEAVARAIGHADTPQGAPAD
jgi:tRNA nucleotidyltransferase (CCA-adding enzyme)